MGVFENFLGKLGFEIETVDEDGKSVWVDMDGASFSTNKVYKVAFNSYMASTVNIESADEGRSMFRTAEEMMIDFAEEPEEKCESDAEDGEDEWLY